MNRSVTTTPFPLLADPAGYVCCVWDLTRDAPRRSYWADLYRRHFPAMLDEGVKVAVADGGPEADARVRAQACRREFFDYLDRVEREPASFGHVDINVMAIQREALLRRHGFRDPYALLKDRETAAALSLLPTLLAAVDELDDPRLAVQLAEGIFAGNIFDVGATQTLNLIRAGRIDFHATRAKLRPRPWLIDDLDAWVDRLTAPPAPAGPPWRCAVVFVDNAGCDVVLGMIPFVRDLLRRGCDVILSANSTPALNDITHTELATLIDRVGALDAVIAGAWSEGRLELIASGGGTPLIDLGRVAPPLAEAVARGGVDLVVLEGMGRAVESNLTAAFTCDALKIAMVKDPDVAAGLGGEVYDLVLRFAGVT